MKDRFEPSKVFPGGGRVERLMLDREVRVGFLRSTPRKHGGSKQMLGGGGERVGTTLPRGGRRRVRLHIKLVGQAQKKNL